MNEVIETFYVHQPERQYESSHRSRFEFLMEDLNLHRFSDTRIGDFGCGYAPLFRRIEKRKNNALFGFDGAHISVPETVCKYYVTDLNVPFASQFLANEKQLDVAFCFETLEHLTNPYNLLAEIKKVLKPDGILYLSIPHEHVTHNTIYPALLYPVGNFEQFLGQMAFEITRHTVHDKSFKQEVFTLVNKPWSDSKMKWHKAEGKFRGLTPEEAINL